MVAPKAVPQKLLIRPWPKMIFLWPTAIVTLFMAFANSMWVDQRHIWGGAFLLIFAINLCVLTFEFPRATSLTLAMGVLAVVLLLLLLNHSFDVIRPLKVFFVNRDIYASTEFYWVFFCLLMLLFIGMFAITRFEYWELTPNEIIHHHGILGDSERFSTAGLKINKEISDVFEYVLCGAGRMTLLIPNVARPVVLDNILNIGRIETLSDQILNARVVRIEGPGGPSEEDHPMSAPVREGDET
jgi:hypothetical protein